MIKQIHKRIKPIVAICCLMVCVMILSSCGIGHSQNSQTEADLGNTVAEAQETAAGSDLARKTQEPQADKESRPDDMEAGGGGNNQDIILENNAAAQPQIIETDWSEYFGGLYGAAVLYDPSASCYRIYNPELADTRRSPCSTFKIISSMLALENGIIDPQDSTHTWSGERFWNENWNQDITFQEAFRTSCVWYFREVIDEMGPEIVQDGLDKLMYGNCDISDWEARLNTNNNNRALTGFWIESSLNISPKEQTEVMERIFGPDSVCSQKTREELKQVMLVTEPEKTTLPIYGKTGMGKVGGIVVDAWFTGLVKKEEETIYFCVYLGQTEDPNVSSTTAREIAIHLVEDYCNEK